MEFTVRQLADYLGGRLTGDASGTLRNLGRIETAGPGDLAFLSNPSKYASFAYLSQATAILVPADFEPEQEITAALIAVNDVQEARSALLRLVADQLPKPAPGIDPLAFVHPTAVVDPQAHIAAFAYVGEGAQIGPHTILEPHSFVGGRTKVGEHCLLQTGARLLHDCVLGNRVRLLANAVVGADGFGHTRRKEDKSWIRVPHIGNVVLEDDVEIGACATIDRAVTGSTILRKGVKLDNLVMVAHNVTIDEHTAAAAQVGIAGSARLGKRILLGGQAGLAGHITIADDVEIAAQSGIKDSIEAEGQKVFGSPAKPQRDWAKDQANIRNVERLEKRLRLLEKEVQSLRSSASTSPQPGTLLD